jgi:hypothetical protein
MDPENIIEGRRAPDLGMPTQAGNNLLYALVQKAKSKRELSSMIDKLALKLGGKYKDAKDELITRDAMDAFDNKSVGASQKTADSNLLQQIKSIEDLNGGTIVLNDKSKIKMDKKTASTVLKNLMNIKPQPRGQAIKAMQKDKRGFDKFIKILNR